MVSWSLAPSRASPISPHGAGVSGAANVTLADTHLARPNFLPRTVELVEGGDSRHASEFNVLRYLAADIESGAIDVVLIHDAARPLAGPDMMRTALAVAREFGGAVPALAAPDVVRSRAGPGLAPPRTDRSLVRVQTPQAFRALPLLTRVSGRRRRRFRGHRHVVVHRTIHRRRSPRVRRPADATSR